MYPFYNDSKQKAKAKHFEKQKTVFFLEKNYHVQTRNKNQTTNKQESKNTCVKLELTSDHRLILSVKHAQE